MSHRINIVLSDSIWELLQAIPKGKRSAFVDKATNAASALQDRWVAAAEMDRMRETTTPVDECPEDWIREGREGRESH